ncbi:hypothetical protein IF2G_07715 [Cordyceps javanica]|nr:hypothetical protein IF2G_07715 [Cordyceps javanica]
MGFSTTPGGARRDKCKEAEASPRRKAFRRYDIPPREWEKQNCHESQTACLIHLDLQPRNVSGSAQGRNQLTALCIRRADMLICFSNVNKSGRRTSTDRICIKNWQSGGAGA